MHMRCRYIHSFCQHLSWFSHHFYQFGARCLQFCQTPKHTDVHTCTRVRLSTCPYRLCESLSLSLSSNRAKDGGQGEVSGCPHHPVVIKARCMLGRIVKLPTETLDMYMCVFILQRDSHTHCCSTIAPQEEFHSPWVNLRFTVFSVSLVSNTFTLTFIPSAALPEAFRISSEISWCLGRVLFDCTGLI